MLQLFGPSWEEMGTVNFPQINHVKNLLKQYVFIAEMVIIQMLKQFWF